MKAFRLTVMVLLAQLLCSGPAEAAPFGGNKNNIDSYRRTYKCRYHSYREVSTMNRFSADGDEKGRIIKIDSSWQYNKSKHAFTKTTKIGELVIEGKTFGPRFVNWVFEIDDMMLTRGHGFVGSPIDYISYYECFDLY